MSVDSMPDISAILGGNCVRNVMLHVWREADPSASILPEWRVSMIISLSRTNRPNSIG